jgi:synaptojanin
MGGIPSRLRRRKSETLRAQYINTKELRHEHFILFVFSNKINTAYEIEKLRYVDLMKIGCRICAGTWNVAGQVPPDDLDLSDWLDMSEPADIYVLG